ncbi:MAG: 5'-3' exonuclease H3TH domain-containing protein, partial [Bacteroidota bacterium]
MSTLSKKLFLLDAYALIYRAHFAFSQNPRISSKGINTGVMFGFTNTLLEVLQKQQPTHIAVAFDTSAPTFRHEQFKEYKANREETPEDIKIGIPIVKDILRGFNIPILELDGYEADDIIGTLAKKAARNGFEVYMMTPDKDFGQLVEDHIFLYKPAYMGNAVDVMGIPEVLAKWDIERVDQVIDMLGLQGDSVDNIPGIPGIGPKTASKLLKEFGSVEGIVANVDKLKGAQQKKIQEFGQQGVLSKELATINVEVPIEFNEESLAYDGPDEEKLTPIFDELEFKTIMKRVFNQDLGTSTNSTGQLDMFSQASKEAIELEEGPQKVHDTIESTQHNYQLLTEESEIKGLVKELNRQKEFCFDTETTGIDAVEAKVVGVAISYEKGNAFYIPISLEMDKARIIMSILSEALENPATLKIGQNIKYDILVLKKYGVHVAGSIFDTMLAHYIIEPETKHSMDVLAEQYLHYSPVSIEKVLGPKGKNQKNMADLEPSKVKDYACEDADITLQLKQKIAAEIDKEGFTKLLNEIELPLVNVLAQMEFEGVKIDEEALASMSKELQEESLKAQEEIFKIAGHEFNIASPKQLGEVL